VAILAGGGFFGVLGMFLGVPVFATLQTLAQYLVERRLARQGLPLEKEAYVKRDLRQETEKEE
jgi:predicted PurR-regulated permease PerM